MVFASFGVIKSEAELRELCDCTIFGTAAMELVRAASQLGFTASRKYSLTLPGLEELAKQGYWPIVYVVPSAGGPAPDVHSFVVVSATEVELAVLDPQLGHRLLSAEEFEAMWTPMRNLAIVIAHSATDRKTD